MCPLNMLISPEHTDPVLLSLPAHCTVTVSFKMTPTNPSTVEGADSIASHPAAIHLTHVCWIDFVYILIWDPMYYGIPGDLEGFCFLCEGE